MKNVNLFIFSLVLISHGAAFGMFAEDGEVNINVSESTFASQSSYDQLKDLYNTSRKWVGNQYQKYAKGDSKADTTLENETTDLQKEAEISVPAVVVTDEKIIVKIYNSTRNIMREHKVLSAAAITAIVISAGGMVISLVGSQTVYVLFSRLIASPFFKGTLGISLFSGVMYTGYQYYSRKTPTIS